MRYLLPATLRSWTGKVIHPAVAATVFGGLFGAALLHVQSDSYEAPSSYSEPAPRAAMYESPASLQSSSEFTFSPVDIDTPAIETADIEPGAGELNLPSISESAPVAE